MSVANRHSKKRRANRVSSAIGAELLESRCLLSASVISKVLTIEGTTASDNIRLTFSKNKVYVVENGAAAKLFSIGLMNSIAINTLAGDDVVTLPQNLPTTITQTRIDLGDGNDSLSGSNRADIVMAGAGDDTVNGNDGDDFIDVGIGNDFATAGLGDYNTITYQSRRENLVVRIDGLGFSGDLAAGEQDTIGTDFQNAVGGRGNDVVIGNARGNVIGGDRGDDTVDGGLGTDTIFGDQGIDMISYATRTASVNVSLDGKNNDGAANERDTLYTIENIAGGSGYDTLSGDDGPNLINGGGGSDRIYGNKGDDTLLGGGGQDRIYGGEGNDSIRGGANRDSLYGESGKDTIFGDDDDDFLDGGIERDRLDGGAGTDRAVTDEKDLLFNLESI